MHPEIEFRQGDFYTTMLRIRGVREDLQRQIKDAVEDAARAGGAELYRRTPIGPTGHLYESIDVDHHATWHPGGAGGGGYWETRVGIGVGADRDLYFVEHGRGESHTPGKHAMTIRKQGEPVRFRKRAKGVKGKKVRMPALLAAQTKLKQRSAEIHI